MWNNSFQTFKAFMHTKGGLHFISSCKRFPLCLFTQAFQRAGGHVKCCLITALTWASVRNVPHAGPQSTGSMNIKKCDLTKHHLINIYSIFLCTEIPILTSLYNYDNPGQIG